MPLSVDDYIQELIDHDPSLLQRQDEARKIVADIIQQRPQTTLSSTHFDHVRTLLMQQPLPSTHQSFRWLPLALAVPVMAVLVIVVWPTIRPSKNVVSTSGVNIQLAGSNAFGLLAGVSTSSIRTSNVNQPAAQDVQTSTAAGADASAKLGSIDGEYRFPVFTYAADTAIPQRQVLQRVKTLSGVVEGIGSAGGLLDLKTFSDVRTDNITWSQQTADGYTISVDVRQGVISLYRNAGDVRIATPERAVSAAVGDVTEEQAVTIAADFLQRHHIDISGLGQPVVQQSVSGFMLDMPATQELAPTAYTTVVYPWVIDGVSVYDESGALFGLQVVVEGSSRTVSSVMNIMQRSFVASSYDQSITMTDIRSYLGRGGWMWSSPIATGQATTAYALEAPTSVYMISRYQLDGGQDDLLVPALRFPVAAADQQKIGRSAVIVPVIRDLISPTSTSSTGDGSVGTQPAFPKESL